MNGLEAMQAFEAMEVITGMQEGDEETVIEAYQELINSGMAWQLEGHVGRTAMSLIEAGKCLLGEVAVRDYYGSLIPSRYDVEPGTMGSLEYAENKAEF